MKRAALLPCLAALGMCLFASVGRSSLDETKKAPDTSQGVDPATMLGRIALGERSSCVVDDPGRLFCFGGTAEDRTSGLGAAVQRETGDLKPVPHGPYAHVAAGPRHMLAVTREGKMVLFGTAREGPIPAERLTPFGILESKVHAIPMSFYDNEAIALLVPLKGGGHGLVFAHELHRDPTLDLEWYSPGFRASHFSGGIAHHCAVRADNTLGCVGDNFFGETAQSQHYMEKEKMACGQTVKGEAKEKPEEKKEKEEKKKKGEKDEKKEEEEKKEATKENAPCGKPEKFESTPFKVIATGTDIKWDFFGKPHSKWRSFLNSIPGANFNPRHVRRAHTCGVTTHGALLCAGNNQNGELGVANQRRFREMENWMRLDPLHWNFEEVTVGEGPWLWVSAGAKNTCAINVLHHLYCFGSNANGQLGVGHTKKVALKAIRRIVIKNTAGEELPCNYVFVGQLHICAMFGTDFYCAGKNDLGQANRDIMPRNQTTFAKVRLPPA